MSWIGAWNHSNTYPTPLSFILSSHVTFFFQFLLYFSTLFQFHFLSRLFWWYLTTASTDIDAFHCCPLSLRWETNLKLKKTWKCICIFGEMGYKFQLPSDPERVSGPERFMNCCVETFIYPTSYRGPCLFFSIIVYFILTLTQTVEANRNLRPDFMTYF